LAPAIYRDKVVPVSLCVFAKEKNFILLGTMAKKAVFTMNTSVGTDVHVSDFTTNLGSDG
jgi:hypothetical protein